MTDFRRFGNAKRLENIKIINNTAISFLAMAFGIAKPTDK